MSYPNIKSRRENFFNHWTTPMINRRNFLNRNPTMMMLEPPVPPANISQDKEIMEIEVVIPGFKKSEISVTVNGDVLTVIGKRQELKFPESKYILREFDVDEVKRKFRLSEEIGKEQIEADYENGILKLKFIDVPKEKERPVKKIAVN